MRSSPSCSDPLRADGLTVNLALGNHDQRENFWAALESQKTARRPVADKQVALVKSKQVNWFMLDSLEQLCRRPACWVKTIALAGGNFGCESQNARSSWFTTIRAWITRLPA